MIHPMLQIQTGIVQKDLTHARRKERIPFIIICLIIMDNVWTILHRGSLSVLTHSCLCTGLPCMQTHLPAIGSALILPAVVLPLMRLL